MATATAEHPVTLEPTYRTAPPGYTREQWAFFEREGYLFIEDAISPADVRRYIDTPDRISADHRRERPGKAFTPWGGIAHLDPVFAELIDHPRHVGFAYDVYGELLKLHNSQAFIRPTGKSETK